MRKQVLFLSGIISCLVLLTTGCQREIDNPGGGGGTPTPPPVIDDNVMVMAGLRGVVVDENNQPVQGAAVTSGTNATTTDRYGVFRFNNINLSKENGYVKVVKSGYFTGSRSFATTAGRIHNVRLKLLPKTNSGNFTGSTGGTITLSNGGKLVMPANAVTDGGGTAFTGQVNIAMTWIDPTATNLSEIMIGDFRGITTDGQERGLQTYGMLGVEMTGAGGQPLKIATGKTAELTFPVPTSIIGAAPATIDLWHFDEVKGRWIQEGTATKTGANYVAQVSHFSFWNCDAPFPLINLCMKIVNGGDNQPLVNASVRIRRPSGGAAYGYTDSTGNLCGKVPKNEALVLEVLDQCHTVAYSQNIGPFSADANLGTITATIPAAVALTITGTVTNCANANVTNGAAVVYITGGHSYAAQVTNGAFSITILHCSGATVNFSVLGVDYSTVQQSVPVSGTGTSGTVNVGTVQACGTSSAQYIELLIDGQPLNFVSPPDNFFSIDSTFGGAGYTNTTTIYASRQVAGSSISCQFSIEHNTVPANGLPLAYVSINGGTGLNSQVMVTPIPVCNLTTYGLPVIGFAEGNFNIQMNFGGTVKNVICNFRVRRN
jgi:hypothetical protein